MVPVPSAARKVFFSTNGFTINHYITMSDLSDHIFFLKAHDPFNPLTHRDDKDNDKYTHKYTNEKCFKGGEWWA